LNSLNAASVDTVQQALMMSSICSIWSYLLGSHIWGLSVHFG